MHEAHTMFMRVALLAAVLFLAPLASQAQDIWEPGVAGEPIPRTDYESWSLFLVCSPSWLLAEQQERLQDLYRQFRAFGTAIGPRHVAIWFWKRRPRWGSAALLEDVDIGRNSEYCARFGLLPSASPHVLVTTTYPDLQAAPGNYYVLSLNGSTAAGITTLLTRLSDQLLVQGLNQTELDSARYWHAWHQSFAAVWASVTDFVTKITLTIDTKFIKVQLEGGG